MLVSAAIQQVKDDLLEVSTAGPFSTSVICNALTEGYRHLRNRISSADAAGQWFAEEVTYAYPGATRWANMTAWTGGTIPPNRVISLLDITSPTSPLTIDFASPQSLVNRGNSGRGQSRYQAVIKGSQIGLREYYTDNPPASSVSTRMIYIPPVTAITDADTAKTIGVDFPFPVDYVEAIIAYAVVRLQASEETPSGQFEGRYNQLEADLLEMVNQRRRQTMSVPEVQLTNRYLYY